MEAKNSSSLPSLAQAALLLLFGFSTSALIQGFGGGGRSPADLLLIAASLGALITSGAWIALLALRRSRRWALAIGLGVWVPYVNLVLLALYARRYWRQDARLAGLLGLAGMLGQTLAALRAVLQAPAPLV